MYKNVRFTLKRGIAPCGILQSEINDPRIQKIIISWEVVLSSVTNLIDLLLNKAIDLMDSYRPNNKFRKLEIEIASLERRIEKEMMLSSPKEDYIKSLEDELKNKIAERSIM
ncbi:hypothetical protein [Methylobacterium sp. 77]|uniref:hypothetical protein n=1 Tax=Methylobacterium sp. 77 TaxID=1101192 RepID=UPI0012DF84FE|nr:hypothetical protein [Methylobacterium sp. 77]